MQPNMFLQGLYLMQFNMFPHPATMFPSPGNLYLNMASGSPFWADLLTFLYCLKSLLNENKIILNYVCVPVVYQILILYHLYNAVPWELECW